jgi:hypothetical protein
MRPGAIRAVLRYDLIVSDFKTDQDRFMGRLEEQAEFLAQEHRRRAEAYAKYRDMVVKNLAVLGIKYDPPETPSED